MVIKMWWIYIVVVALMVFAVYGFITFVGFNTRRLTSKTDRTAENMYDEFSDPPRKRQGRS